MIDHKQNPLAWDINANAKPNTEALIEAKRAAYTLDCLYHEVFSTPSGKLLLDKLQEIIVNKIGYNGHLPHDKAVANMLIRDAQAMLVQAFQAGVERIKKAPSLEEYANL